MESDMREKSVRNLLLAGIAAAKAGQREAARQLLTQVVECDERNATAWLWLGGAVDTLDDQEVCLENVLTLDPGNEAAQKGLARVRQKKGGQELSQPAAEPAGAPASQQAPAERPVSPAAEAILVAGPSETKAADNAEYAPAAVQSTDEFDNPYLCPYCAVQTEPEDRRCEACGQALWARFRRRKRPSSWLGFALVFQGFAIVLHVFLISLLLGSAASRAGVSNPFGLLPLYLGLPGSLPAETAQVALGVVPRSAVWTLGVPLLYAAALFAALNARWPLAYYAYLANAEVTFVLAVATAFMGRVGQIIAGAGCAAAAVMFFITLQMEDDFFFKEARLLLRLDSGARGALDFLSRGFRYARNEAWAMAVIHLRRAVGMLPERTDGHLALATAYVNLKRYDLAGQALERARALNPQDPEIGRIEAFTRRTESKSRSA